MLLQDCSWQFHNLLRIVIVTKIMILYSIALLYPCEAKILIFVPFNLCAVVSGSIYIDLYLNY